jgi:hypothetical protein
MSSSQMGEREKRAGAERQCGNKGSCPSMPPQCNTRGPTTATARVVPATDFDNDRVTVEMGGGLAMVVAGSLPESHSHLTTCRLVIWWLLIDIVCDTHFIVPMFSILEHESASRLPSGFWCIE